MATPENRVLIIDDDVELCELVTEYLCSQGFDVEAVQDGDRGCERALSGEHRLVVLDVMLPGIDGFEVLRRIRAVSMLPVLMLTARGDDVDRIIGLELGADDYLPKPFNPRELSARVRAIIRRAGAQAQSAGGAGDGERITVGDIAMDVQARRVRRGDAPVELTGAEFDLLEVLLRAAGTVVKRDELFRSVLDRDPLPMDRSIDMHVSHLRRKLGPPPGGAERIKAIRGVGYVYTCETVAE